MIKRIFDLVLVIPALAILSPLMLVIAAVIRCTSAGPALFLQSRIGRSGRPFEVIKFRTMVDPSVVHGGRVTADGDARITRAGRVLRRHKLDELPQLFNVLKGDMSLVGPRPEVAEYVALYPRNAREKVLSVRPGLTGPDSLAFRNESRLLAEAGEPLKRYTQDILPRKLEFQLAYVRNRSMGGDLHLLWATALALFGGSTDSVRPEVTRLVSRNMELQELLGRASIDFERSLVREQIAGKAVLITGAGGSIGSELARNVARYEPRTLVLFDISEASLFTIDRELRDNHPELSIVAAVGDVGDRVHVKFILEKHGVDVIYHAAAYKHVPMMESNVAACVINNTLGTERLVSEAEAHAVEHFVFISTDKALRPAGVMGASKRVAERIIQARPASSTRFVIVRFGNVLGSSGSVLPIFRQQIAEGGPVTVTTPDAKRFFMSIPEAVDLVLQAGVKGGDRDIMMLDMGPLVRIADLARRLIERSGLKVGKDIQIVYTGLRAGEKESEELITNVEGIEPTPQQGLWFVRDQGDARRRPVDLGALERYVKDRDEMAIRKELTRLTSEASASVLGDSPAKASSTNFDAPDERIDKPRKAAR